MQTINTAAEPSPQSEKDEKRKASAARRAAAKAAAGNETKSLDDMIETHDTIAATGIESYQLAYNPAIESALEQPRKNKQGEITGYRITLRNMSLLFASWKIGARKNEMRPDRIELTGLESRKYFELSDASELWLANECSQVWWLRECDALEKTVRKYLALLAENSTYHPILQYLQGLEWDGVPRLDEWITSTTDTPADEPESDRGKYVRAASRIPLLAAVKRILEPGSEADEMTVLIGPQGGGKSKAIKYLCHDARWFTDCLPIGAGGQKTLEGMSGKWLAEASEMVIVRSATEEGLKAWMSRCVDTARLSYAHHPIDVPRCWTMIGTTNRPRFLDDPTGGRRYLPLEVVGNFDHKKLAEMRDQLWAEAYHRVKVLGESCRLPEELWAVAAKFQAEARIENPLEDVLRKKLSTVTGYLLNCDLWQLANVPLSARKGSSDLKCAMEAIGWTEKRSATERGWQHPSNTSTIPEPIHQSFSGEWIVGPAPKPRPHRDDATEDPEPDPDPDYPKDPDGRYTAPPFDRKVN